MNREPTMWENIFWFSYFIASLGFAIFAGWTGLV